MARRSHVTNQRNKANRMADLVEGPATQPTRLAIPELLARAVATIEAWPALVAWEEGEPVALEGTGFRLRRIFRVGWGPSSSFDVIVLYNPDHRDVAAFPVATLVGTQYRPMTDVNGFRQWLSLQGVA